MKSCIWILINLFAATAVFAGLYTVSSDGLADYSNVQDAINGAVSGDTILVYPGGVYPGFVVDKRLIIMGAGIESALNKNTKIAGTVTLTSTADGTELRSLWIVSDASSGSVITSANATLKVLGDCYDVFVWRCLIENNQPSGGVVKSALFVGDTASVRLHQCALWSSQNSSGNAYAIIADSISAISLESCVLVRWAYQVYAGSGTTAASPLSIRNCLFESFNYFGFTGGFSGAVENSVFISFQNVNVNTPNLTYSYNITMGTPGSNFVNFLSFDAQNSDYHLAGGSILIDGGNPSSPFDLDGTRADIGVYGGQHPYVKNGAPDYPFVIELEVPTSAPIDGSFPVFSRGRIGPGN
jgi:hypothetical protein